jgi:hypothetical protein
MESVSINRAWYEAIKDEVVMENTYFYNERPYGDMVEADIPDINAFNRASIRAGFMEEPNSMTTRDFLLAYADNMHTSLCEREHSIKSMNFNCEFCPFREDCHKDDTERDCAKFIVDHIKDMTGVHGYSNYRER